MNVAHQTLTITGKQNLGMKKKWMEVLPWLQYEQGKGVWLCKYRKESDADSAGPTLTVYLKNVLYAAGVFLL